MNDIPYLQIPIPVPDGYRIVDKGRYPEIGEWYIVWAKDKFSVPSKRECPTSSWFPKELFVVLEKSRRKQIIFTEVKPDERQIGVNYYCQNGAGEFINTQRFNPVIAYTREDKEI